MNPPLSVRKTSARLARLTAEYVAGTFALEGLPVTRATWDRLRRATYADLIARRRAK